MPPHKNTAKDIGLTGVSGHDATMIVTAYKHMKGPIEVDWKAFADELGYKSASVGQTQFAKTRARIKKLEERGGGASSSTAAEASSSKTSAPKGSALKGATKKRATKKRATNRPRKRVKYTERDDKELTDEGDGAGSTAHGKYNEDEDEQVSPIKDENSDGEL